MADDGIEIKWKWGVFKRFFNNLVSWIKDYVDKRVGFKVYINSSSNPYNNSNPVHLKKNTHNVLLGISTSYSIYVDDVFQKGDWIEIDDVSRNQPHLYVKGANSSDWVTVSHNSSGRSLVMFDGTDFTRLSINYDSVTA